MCQRDVLLTHRCSWSVDVQWLDEVYSIIFAGTLPSDRHVARHETPDRLVFVDDRLIDRLAGFPEEETIGIPLDDLLFGVLVLRRSSVLVPLIHGREGIEGILRLSCLQRLSVVCLDLRVERLDLWTASPDHVEEPFERPTANALVFALAARTWSPVLVLIKTRDVLRVLPAWHRNSVVVAERYFLALLQESHDCDVPRAETKIVGLRAGVFSLALLRCLLMLVECCAAPRHKALP